MYVRLSVPACTCTYDVLKVGGAISSQCNQPTAHTSFHTPEITKAGCNPCKHGSMTASVESSTHSESIE